MLFKVYLIFRNFQPGVVYEGVPFTKGVQYLLLSHSIVKNSKFKEEKIKSNSNILKLVVMHKYLSLKNMLG